MKLSVRNYKKGDEAAWLSVVNDGLKDCLGYEARTMSDFLSWKDSGQFEEKGLFFAQDGEDVVGTVAAVPLKHLAKKKARVTDLAVLPSHRRHGVGSALLNAAVTYFEKAGVKEAEAWSWDAASFLEFYQKRGFKPVRKQLAIYWNLTKPFPKFEVNTKVDVKNAKLTDLDVLAELASKAYLPYWDWWYEDYGGTERVRAEWRKRVQEELESGYVHFIALDEGTPIGFSAAQIDQRLIENKGVKLGTIWGGVAVLPEYRRRHVGSRLLKESLLFLRKKGMEKAMVGTFSYLGSNAPAVNLYVKSGGKITREFVSMIKQL
jgi:GNAT superfamily N-acetyltransferase